MGALWAVTYLSVSGIVARSAFNAWHRTGRIAPIVIHNVHPPARFQRLRDYTQQILSRPGAFG